MSDLLHKTAQYASDYLGGVPERRVFPTDEALAGLAQFDEPLPIGMSDPQQTIDLLHAAGSPATVATTGGRYFGFVTGGAHPVSVAANWLATAWDQNAGLFLMSPTASKLETVAMQWLKSILGLPGEVGGAFVTGATMANFSALATARHVLLERAGWDVEADGLFGAPPIRVVVSDEVHISVLKALGLLGFGRKRVIRVPTDAQGRMKADSLPILDDRTLVCVQAGNVNTGAFDPIADVVTAAHAVGAWVHVDGAFGMWAAAAPDREHLVAGMTGADSWATDGHKWLNVPYDSGLVFVRQPDQLAYTMSMNAEYIIRSQQRDPAAYTPEMSRRARGVEVWAVLRTLGKQGIAQMLECNCQQAARFAEGLRDAGYTILNDVVLNQVLVDFGDAETTDRAIAALQAEGTCWCGATTWQGHRAMRISVSSWETTDDDVERSLDAMIRAAQSVTQMA